MKRWFLILFLLVPMAVRAQAPSYVTVSLNYSYAAYPACTATVTKNCISGFNIYDTTSTKVLMGSIANPTNASGSMTVVGNITFASAPALGTHSVTATAAYVDATGGAGESAQSAPATFPVSPGAPSGVTLALH